MPDIIVINNWELGRTQGSAPPDAPTDWTPYYGSGAAAFLAEFDTSPEKTPSIQYRDAITGDLISVHPYPETPDYQPGGFFGTDADISYGPGASAVTEDFVYICGWNDSAIWKLNTNTDTQVWRLDGYQNGMSAPSHAASTICPVLHPSGGLIYVPDVPNSNAFIALNTSDGSFNFTVPLIGSIKPTQGCAIDPNGDFIFSYNDSFGGPANVRGIYKLNATTGVVTQLIDLSTLGLSFDSFSGDPYLRCFQIAPHPTGDGFAFTVQHATTGPSYHSTIVESSWSGIVGDTYNYTASGLDGQRLAMFFSVCYSSDGTKLYSSTDTSWPIIWKFDRGPGSVGGDAVWMHANYNTHADWVADGSPTDNAAGKPGRLWDATTAGTALYSACSPPANDDIANAEVLVGDSGSTSGTNVCATFEGGEPSDVLGTGTASVWYKWIPSEGGTVTINCTLFALNCSMAMFVEDPFLNDYICVGADVIVCEVAAGTTYYIRVNNKDGDNGTASFDLTWSLEPCGSPPPANDDFANAEVLTGASGSVTGTNVCATYEVGEPPKDDGGAGSSGNKTVWYKWTALEDGATVFDTFGSSFDTVLHIYTGASLGSLVLLVANDDDGGMTSSVSFTAISGQIYYIRVNGYGSGNYGDIILNWTSPEPAPSTPIVEDVSIPPLGGKLGCSQHVAYVQEKCNGPRLCELSDLVEVQYDRRLDDISEATVTIPISGDVDDPCCDCLASIEPWCHQLTIVRELDGVVWTGPITRVIYGYNNVIIEAKDKLAWLQKRVNEIPVVVAYPNTTIELTTLAKMIVEVAMADDDSPCLIDSVLDLGDGFPAGTDRSVGNGFPNTDSPALVGFEAFGGPTAYDDILTLANSGMDFTVMNQAILFQSEKLPDIAIGILTDEMILGEIEVIKDGTLAANRVWVRYQGDDDCDGVCTPQGSITCPCPGEADGAQECYGLLETVIADDSGGAVDLVSANVIAQTNVDAFRLVPRVIEFPSDTRLSPECPWALNDMIPGQRLDVALSKLCVPVYQGFKIQQVTVTDNSDGETIGVTLKTQTTS